MLRQNFYRFSFLLIILCLGINFLQAQDQVIPDSPKKIKFLTWIQNLEQDHSVHFSYNHSLFDRLTVPYFTNCIGLDSCLYLIQENVPVQFELISPNDYLIVPIRKTAYFNVIEQDSEEPIIPINVTINGNTGIYLFPENNGYQINDLFSTDSIQIYSRFHKTIQLTATELLESNGLIIMIPDTININEVVIENYLGKGIDSRLDNHSISVNMKSLGLLSGETDGDVLTTIKNIPGIRTPDGKPGSLNIRGSSFDQTLVLFDDVPIYHTGHFFGTISPYNPLSVDEVRLHRGVFPAKWGGRVGGLIDIKTDEDIIDSASYTALINTLYLGVSIKQPIIKKKLGLSLSYRSNYTGNYLSPKLEEFSDLNFQGSRISGNSQGAANSLERLDIKFKDINGKLLYQLNKKHNATISFINIDNNFASDFNSPNQNLLETQRLELDNWGFTGKINSIHSKKTKTSLSFTKSSLSIFDRSQELRVGMIDAFESIQNKIEDIRFMTDVKTKIKTKHELSAGYSLIEHGISFDETSSTNSMKQEFNDATIHSLHAALKMNWKTRFLATVGLHSDYYEPTESIFLDPRIFLTYMLNEFLFLKSSGGRSHQFIQQLQRRDFDDFRVNNQFWFLPKTTSEVIESNQGMIGLLFERSSWLIDIEMYQKETNGVQTQNLVGEIIPGSIAALGVDLFVKKEWKSIETWISYSYSNIESKFETTETSFYEQPHSFNITSLLHHKKWNFSISWDYATGLPVNIPMIDPTEPNNDGQSELTVPFSQRFPAQHQLDVSSTYSFASKKKKWNALVGLSINNVYNQKNIINIFQSNTNVNNPYRMAIGIAPNAHIKISF